jgi:hypothetical protein
MVIALLSAVSNAVAQSPSDPQPPSFDRVVAALNEYFASLKGYQPNDLLNQSRVEQALAHVTDVTGWEIPDREATVERALADNSFIASQLSTPGGRRFMRSIARHAGSYSRLDRLSTISGGQQLIKKLIGMKDGSDLIEYLSTTSGGRRLGAMMAGVEQGVNLNKPTGRIYTADDLLAALKESYEKQ